MRVTQYYVMRMQHAVCIVYHICMTRLYTYIGASRDIERRQDQHRPLRPRRATRSVPLGKSTLLEDGSRPRLKKASAGLVPVSSILRVIAFRSDRSHVETSVQDPNAIMKSICT